MLADVQQPSTASPDAVLRHLIANARSEAVREQFMQSPASEYTTHQDASLLVASYNVNGRAPAPDADLREWLAVGGSQGEPSIVAVGFQELVPLNAGNIVMGGTLSSVSEKAVHWKGAELHALSCGFSDAFLYPNSNSS